MESKEPKVSDIVKLDQDLLESIRLETEVLSNLSEEYAHLTDPGELEILKRQFNGHLQRYAFLFSKIKMYKGDSHSYLSDARKRIKAETMAEMLKRGDKITLAQELVYGDEKYKKYMSLIEDLKRLCERTDLLYQRFEVTLQCIIQSVSVASKELQNTRATGG